MSRKVLILANVGNHDVRYRGDREDNPAGGKTNEVSARKVADWLLENYEDVADDIDLPIIPKGVRYVESLSYKYKEILGRSGAAPRMELFCTDQQPRHEKDTIGFARIIEKMLPGKFPNDKSRDLRLNETDPVTINTIQYNPSHYDDMYNYYEEFFDQKAPEWKPGEVLCFVFTSGGTPAMNMALILHAVRHFGESCVQIYIPDRSEPSELRVGEELVRSEIEHRFNKALEALQFRSAARILEDTSRGDYQAHACRYAEHRLAFDFRRAIDHCREAIQDSSKEMKKYLEAHERHTRLLSQGGSALNNRVFLIEELFYNLEVKYELGEFVDVLGRLFRLQEALLGWIVQLETGIKTDEDKKIEEEETLSVRGLREYLLEKFPHGTKVNRYSLTIVSGYLVKPAAGLPAERKESVKKVRKAANKINMLSNIRNESIITHSFRGASEADIIDLYRSDGLIEDLRASVGAALNRDLSTNPFFDLSERLRF